MTNEPGTPEYEARVRYEDARLKRVANSPAPDKTSFYLTAIHRLERLLRVKLVEEPGASRNSTD